MVLNERNLLIVLFSVGIIFKKYYGVCKYWGACVAVRGQLCSVLFSTFPWVLGNCQQASKCGVVVQVNNEIKALNISFSFLCFYNVKYLGNKGGDFMAVLVTQQVTLLSLLIYYA